MTKTSASEKCPLLNSRDLRYRRHYHAHDRHTEHVHLCRAHGGAVHAKYWRSLGGPPVAEKGPCPKSGHKSVNFVGSSGRFGCNITKRCDFYRPPQISRLLWNKPQLGRVIQGDINRTTKWGKIVQAMSCEICALIKKLGLRESAHELWLCVAKESPSTRKRVSTPVQRNCHVTRSVA